MGTIVMTGAGSGMGLACARRLASAGQELGLADVDAASLEPVVAELGGTPVVRDVTDAASLVRLSDVFATSDRCVP